MANEVKKEEAQVKANVESAKVEENNVNVEETKEVVTNIFKSFDIQPKETSYGLSYYLKLQTYGNYAFEIKLSESQRLLITEVGKEHCFPCVESRFSTDKRKNYLVVALHVGDIDTFDLFPRERNALSLAKLYFDKYANK